MMTKKTETLQLKNAIILLLTALIWGVSFVAQSKGGTALGPFAFNAIRSIIGGVVLIPAIFLLDKMGITGKKSKGKKNRKMLLTGGISCGVVLFIASNAQQVGMYYGTTAGKAGFITACYILIVPILGVLFLKKKCGWNIWVAVGLALVGLYLLCVGTGSFEPKMGDLLVLLGAFMFSVHILVIDKYSPKVDGVRMSCIQFFTCGILTLIPAFFVDCRCSLNGLTELFGKLGTSSPWIPLLYAGIMSCGVAYTLQIIGQEGQNPAIASLLLSFESVFSVLASWIIMKEQFTGVEVIGCVIMFGAIILAQLKLKPLKKILK